MRYKKLRKAAQKQSDETLARCVEQGVDYDSARMAVALMYDAVGHIYKGDERGYKEAHITVEAVSDLLTLVEVGGETLADATDHPATWPIGARFLKMRRRLTFLSQLYDPQLVHDFRGRMFAAPHNPDLGIEANWWRRMANTYAIVAEIAEAQDRA